MKPNPTSAFLPRYLNNFFSFFDDTHFSLLPLQMRIPQKSCHSDLHPWFSFLKYVSEAIMVPEELWIGLFSNLVVKHDTSPFITGLICPLTLGFEGALRGMHRTLKLIRLTSQCWPAHLLQPGCSDRTLQDAELPAAHPKPDRDTGLRQNHPGPQIFVGAKMLCPGSKIRLARVAVEPWCPKGRNTNPAKGPAQGCSHALVNPFLRVV